MIQPEYFLDTCIYVGYAVEFDVYNDKCKKLCDGNYPKNTSYTVKNEIDEITRDYRKFQKALNSNGYDLDAIIKTQTNPNRIQFLEQLKKRTGH